MEETSDFQMRGFAGLHVGEVIEEAVFVGQSL